MASNYFVRGLLPWADSSSFAYPNFWSPMNSQGLWKEGLWRNVVNGQRDDFASRGIMLSGASMSSVSALVSGNNLTRNSGLAWNLSGSQVKYIVGSTSIGTTVSGFSSYDDIRILGSANYAFTNFAEPLSGGETGWGTNPNLRRTHVFALAGVEGFAYPGRRISADMATGSGVVDPRTGTLMPLSALDVTPAVVDVALGMSGGVIIDNKRGGFCTPTYRFGNPPQTSSGFIGSAIAVRSTVGSATDGSWVNVGSAMGLLSNFYVSNAVLPASDGHFCNNCERAGSQVGQWIALNVSHLGTPTTYCAPITFGASVGAFLEDQTPYASGGGAALLAPQAALLDLSPDALPVERFSSLVARASIVAGDSQANPEVQGYSTDVVHVRDVMHLTPRTEPPVLGSQLPPPERVGLMYYDIGRNALRVSVALSESEESSDWRDAAVGWADVLIDMSTVTPATGASPLAPEVAAEKMKNVRRQVAEKRSGFIQPHVQAVGTLLYDSTGLVTVFADGFPELPRVFWKLAGEGKDKTGETAWTEISSEELRVTDPESSDHFEFSIDFLDLSSSTAVPFLPDGRVMKLMALHPVTGQAVGTSLRFE